MEVPLLFVLDLRPATDSLSSPVLAQRLGADQGKTEDAIAPTTIAPAGPVTGPVVHAAAGLVTHAAVADPAAAAYHEVRKLKIGGATVGDGLDLARGYRSKLTELELGLPALRALSGEDPRTKVAF